MSSSPASVSIVSLEIIQASSLPRSSLAALESSAAFLTLNITNFDLPRDGFIIVYMIRTPPASTSHATSHDGGDVDVGDDDDDAGRASDPGLPTHVDAVTYAGAFATH
jgi:hypothetical protein